MAELIDREARIADDLVSAFNDGYKQGKEDAVVHGRWKGAGMGDYYCSVCSETVSGNSFNYCPNCGALMDGEKDNKEESSNGSK